MLFTSLDYETTLRQVAQMSVPVLCGLVRGGYPRRHGLQRLATAHVDPAKVELAEELLAKYPPDLSSGAGLGEVLRTGQPLLMPELTDEMIAAGASDPEHLAALARCRSRSVMMAPLNARGAPLG